MAVSNWSTFTSTWSERGPRLQLPFTPQMLQKDFVCIIFLHENYMRSLNPQPKKKKGLSVLSSDLICSPSFLQCSRLTESESGISSGLKLLQFHKINDQTKCLLLYTSECSASQAWKQLWFIYNQELQSSKVILGGLGKGLKRWNKWRDKQLCWQELGTWLGNWGAFWAKTGMLKFLCMHALVTRDSKAHVLLHWSLLIRKIILEKYTFRRFTRLPI